MFNYNFGDTADKGLGILLPSLISSCLFWKSNLGVSGARDLLFLINLYGEGCIRSLQWQFGTIIIGIFPQNTLEERVRHEIT
jgi:hypothetical protein